MPDFLASVLVFSVVLSIFLFSWNSVTAPSTGGSQVQREAFYTSTFLVSTPGYPENWTAETVQIPGLAVRDNVISTQKLRRFSQIPNQERQRLLGAQNYFLNTSVKDLPIVFENPNYGNPPPDNASTVAAVRRDVIVEAPKYPDGLLVPEDPTADGRVAYRSNFTIEPGSNTIDNSMNSVDIDTNASQDMFSGITFDNITYAGVDKDPLDGKIDKSLMYKQNGVDVSNDGSDIKIKFEGDDSYYASANDSMLIRIEGVRNPSTGYYTVDATTSGDNNEQVDQFRIGSVDYPKVSSTGEVSYIQWR